MDEEFARQDAVLQYMQIHHLLGGRDPSAAGSESRATFTTGCKRREVLVKPDPTEPGAGSDAGGNHCQQQFRMVMTLSSMVVSVYIWCTYID